MMSPTELRNIRRDLRLTQTQLAVKLGMTRDAIAKMEAGKRKIRQTTVLALERISETTGPLRV